MSSVFAKIIRRELPARILYEDNDFISIIPKNHFVNPGHILVIPKLEVDHIWDLPQEVYTDLWEICRELAVPLKDISKAKRIGIVVEGFSVPHVHVHLCPINNADELDPHRREEWLATDRDEFAKAFRNLISESQSSTLKCDRMK